MIRLCAGFTRISSFGNEVNTEGTLRRALPFQGIEPILSLAVEMTAIGVLAA